MGRTAPKRCGPSGRPGKNVRDRTGPLRPGVWEGPGPARIANGGFGGDPLDLSGSDPMKNIAVIGWGSLIWSLGCLELQSGWRQDGPLLPVEFARVSRDGRLTLVIVESDEVDDRRALWALSGFSDVECAIENLHARHNGVDRELGWAIEAPHGYGREHCWMV